MQKNYDVGAYVWPSYSGNDTRNHLFWDEGYGEWQSVKSAGAKFEGHTWPRKPVWGYVNEADPAVMEMEIEEAVSHGVNIFIYDWYWFDRRPFLENCLNEGFLKAPNRSKMKFFIMWANHDASTFWNKRLSDREEVTVWSGQVDRKEFEKLVHRFIENYFSQENYYKINGCPVFDLYYLQNFIRGMGSVDAAADAMNYFREETKKAGYPDLHLMLTLLGNAANYASADFLGFDMKETLEKIRFDSATHYQFAAVTDMGRDYSEILPDAKAEWEAETRERSCTYFPHVSLGWDNNPRTDKRLMPMICRNNTPEAVETALRMARDFVDEHGINPPLVTVNSWNEWTETSYLQPDDINGYGYLDAVKKVFKEGK